MKEKEQQAAGQLQQCVGEERRVEAEMQGALSELQAARERHIKGEAECAGAKEALELLLLDINMPRLDGFGVLEVMKQRNWLQEIPVIITSSEDDESFIQKAYELGVTDHIRRPFNLTVTQRRVSNALTLYARQKHLVRLAEEQVYEREKTNSAIINILSHVVESRNFESGTHILHVRAITDILLRQLICTFRNGAQNRKEASWLTTNFSLACSPQRRR